VNAEQTYEYFRSPSIRYFLELRRRVAIAKAAYAELLGIIMPRPTIGGIKRCCSHTNMKYGHPYFILGFLRHIAQLLSCRSVD